LLPLESPRHKCSLRVPVLHLRNGGSRTVYTKLVLRLPQSPRAHQEPSKHRDHLGAVKLQELQARTPSLDLSTQLSHVCTLKLLLTKKEGPRSRGRESQMARTHSPSLLGCNGSSEWQRQLKRGRGVIFIGLAREASR
jgi:hypothetical protein